jgi:hypothetical protein
MTAFTIVESGMTFGPFERDDCFEIETCATYKKINKRGGVKIAEFVWLRPPASAARLWIVEAKSKAPKELGVYSRDLRDKFVNALTMVVCACLGRPGSASDELPVTFGRIDLAKIRPVFVLVVREHPDDGLDSLAAALRKALQPAIKTWGVVSPDVVVMNRAMARRKKLVQ